MVKLELVQNDVGYYNYIFQLRMSPLTKDGWVSEETITWNEHKKFMDEHIEDYYVCLREGERAGFIGVVDGDIRVCTDPFLQRKGVGSFMLSEIKKIYPNATAKVKIANLASVALFEKSGVKFEMI
jgi:RimJ/RimL family protein N-acetyltransferase